MLCSGLTFSAKLFIYPNYWQTATRVYDNLATLTDDILTNKVDVEITSGNIISYIGDHYSQFCISHNFIQRPKPGKQKRRDFSGYSRSKFNSELSDALVSQTNFSDQFDVDTAFSHFYNTLLALIDKHAPLRWFPGFALRISYCA